MRIQFFREKYYVIYGRQMLKSGQLLPVFGTFDAAKGPFPMRRNVRQLFTALIRRYPRRSAGVLLLLGLGYMFSLPHPLFREPFSLVLEDRQGELLGARIAIDGQWRFPPPDSVPDRFATALIEFEDHRFYFHPGVDPLAIGRALLQNLRNGHVVSGGSTLTMQVIRLARGDRRRSLGQKMIEAILATRLELGCSKKKILTLYAAHAPFGGNVVGLEAAAWRYFGKSPALLSWGEAALLAVLPNSPALIHPGRNRDELLAKRNRLLDRLLDRHVLDTLDWELARAEALPDQPHPLPRLAPQLLDRIARQSPSGRGPSRFRSTLDLTLQRQAERIVDRHQQTLQFNKIHNLAALVLDVENNETLTYVGNAPGAGADHAGDVDIITAPRSTGSILKPFLYAALLQEGQLLPTSLVPDVPSTIHGFRPENFNQQYDGAVPARQALSRSLNVPMVYMLQDYGLEKFHFTLRHLGFSTITRPPDHYGLTLILGGAEATLWDIANAYAGMSRVLDHFYPYNSRYDAQDFRPASFLSATPTAPGALQRDATHISAGAAWFTFEAMQQLERPDSEGQWEQFSSSRRLAWKTGTSFGFRDAWAVGVTPRYVVAVWAGNADGEGRPGLIGVQAAAPVLFDLIDLLPAGDWFAPPYDDMIRLPICRQSGYRALPICPVDTVWAPRAGERVRGCPYHRMVHLSADGQWQVNSSCALPADIRHEPWFVLPALQEHYYRTRQPSYRPLPPFHPDCRPPENDDNSSPMQLIYPRQLTRIFVPVDLDGQLQRTIFSVAHRRPNTTIYWHLDQEYLGATQTFHQMELQPRPGKHLLTLVDEEGNRLEQWFEIVGRR